MASLTLVGDELRLDGETVADLRASVGRGSMRERVETALLGDRDDERRIEQLESKLEGAEEDSWKFKDALEEVGEMLAAGNDNEARELIKSTLGAA